MNLQIEPYNAVSLRVHDMLFIGPKFISDEASTNLRHLVNYLVQQTQTL